MDTQTIETLPTPCLLLDRGVLMANAARMEARALALGVGLRPHLKTVKSAAVADAVLGGDRSRGVTVSTVAEAAYFAGAGYTDILYAVCVTPEKLDRLVGAVGPGGPGGPRVSVQVLTDDAGVAGALAARGALAGGGKVGVLIEIDSGQHRSGVSAEGGELLAIAGALSGSAGVELLGVMTHAGHSYGCGSVEGVRAVAEDERRAVVAAAGRLRGAGHGCPVVSVGSTPTAVHAVSGEGVTEMRPGVYLLGDVFQAAIGSMGLGDIACSVLATVISCSADGKRAWIDAGGIAMSKDRSTAGTAMDCGYGLVCEARTGEPLADWYVASVHQEHGEVLSASGGELPGRRLRVGDRVRVLPNHSCMTAAAYEGYHVLDGGGVLTGEYWGRCAGW